jgi:hypothetical protein
VIIRIKNRLTEGAGAGIANRDDEEAGKGDSGFKRFDAAE